MTFAGEKKCRPSTCFAAALVAFRDHVDVEIGRVGREDRAGLGNLVELGEDFLLQRHVLEHRLDDEVGVGDVGKIGRALDQRHPLVDIVSGDRTARRADAVVLLDHAEAALAAPRRSGRSA